MTTLTDETLPGLDDEDLGAKPTADPEPIDINPKTGKPFKWSRSARAAQSARLRKVHENTTDTIAASVKPKRGKASSSAGTEATPPELIMAAAGLMQLPAFALTIASAIIPSLRLDAQAFALHTMPIAKAVGKAAVTDDWIRGLLQKTAEIGPRGEIVIAALPLIYQILANHGIMKPNREAGLLTPDELGQAMETMSGGSGS